MSGAKARPARRPTGPTLVKRLLKQGDNRVRYRRLVPFAANSIRVRLTQRGALVSEQLMVRPANGGNASAQFDQITPGNTLLSAVAYPSADGTGVAQAQATDGLTVIASQTVPVHLTLASTIDRLEVTPAPPTTLAPGSQVQLTATAKNASGEVVITSTGTLPL